MNINEYAKKILEDAGCDQYTYGGAQSEFILKDLKDAFPNGMEFPYVDVANAILEMSRPEPIKISPWLVVWDNYDCTDCIGAPSLEDAKSIAIEILENWMSDRASECPSDFHHWNTEEIEDWDYMIENLCVSVSKYNPLRDEYEPEYWEPSYEDKQRIGWQYYHEFIKRGDE